MRGKECQRFARRSRKPNVSRDSREDKHRACCGKPRLLAAPTVGSSVGLLATMPYLRRHPAARYGMADLVVRDAVCALEHHHAAVQHIEGEVCFPAYKRSDRPFQNRDFFSAVEALYLEREAYGPRVSAYAPLFMSMSVIVPVPVGVVVLTTILHAA
jgi:hypothetical protein